MKKNLLLPGLQKACWQIIVPVLFFIFCSAYETKAQPQVSFVPFITNMKKPVNLTHAGDSSGRIFIVEQYGKIRVYKNGALQARPFLDMTNMIDTAEYRGIWSIAFSPYYETNGYFYVYYIDTAGSTILARFKVSKKDPDSAVASSRVVLLSIPLSATNNPHMGEIHFGRDGDLYISINDGSFYDATTVYAQDTHSWLGKILRLKVDINKPPYYKIPKDNPFVNNPDYLPEIWAIGFRNAWRWSFDRYNGNVWITDVGADNWEEVDMRKPRDPAGANFGWACYEANMPFDSTKCTGGNYVPPVFAYPHESPTSGECIIGGYVYRGSLYKQLQGYYICADYNTGKVYKLIANKTGGYDSYIQTDGPNSIESFGEDENGELYATSQNGTVYKVVVGNGSMEVKKENKTVDANGNPIQ